MHDERCQLWLALVFSDKIAHVHTYSYKLREFANRRVRLELELHYWKCRSDAASSEICGECVEAHGE
jgi:hypothetical protein